MSHRVIDVEKYFYFNLFYEPLIWYRSANVWAPTTYAFLWAKLRAHSGHAIIYVKANKTKAFTVGVLD